MKNARKMIAYFLILVVMVVFIPLSIVNAGVTDTEGDSKIIRKTTTNYFTTVEIKGTLYNEYTGEEFSFNKTSDEITGNVEDESIQAIITSYKDEFNSWANESGATKIDKPDEGISNYYYDAHDEITQSDAGEGNSDVILVGDIDDLDSAYAAQGTITIETILDKHQTYTIVANATVEDNGIKNVNINLTAPIVGKKVSVTQKTDPEYGFTYEEADKHPIATSNTDNIKVDFTYWITGTYPEIGEGYDKLFDGTFEKDKYYYAEIGICADNNVTLSKDLTIKVNGEAPAEVFGIYSNNTETHFIAKIKAVEKQIETKPETVNYKVLNGDNQTVDIGKAEELTFRFSIEYSDFKANGKVYVDGKEVASSNYTSKEGSTIITFNDEYKNNLQVGEHTLKVEVADGEVSAKFKIAKSETTTEDTTKSEEKINTENKATENKTTNSNPKTGDNIIIYAAIFAIAILGITIIVKLKDKI